MCCLADNSDMPETMAACPAERGCARKVLDVAKVYRLRARPVGLVPLPGGAAGVAGCHVVPARSGFARMRVAASLVHVQVVLSDMT